jgi:small-conductance mechanosensitive channel
MHDLKSTGISVAIAVGAVVSGLVIHWILKIIVTRIHHRKPISFHNIPIHLEQWFGPLQALLPVIFLAITLPFLNLPKQAVTVVNHIIWLWIIAGISWLVIRTLYIIRDMILSQYNLNVQDNLKARRVYTQLRVIERVLTVIILIISVAVMLMTFDKMRQLGVSVLASAGIMGIVLGFAAQKSLGTLFAGIQIAIAQPIRIDDVVIIDNEWGRIEEINLTYVVVRIWDLRRLIVPITYFIDNTFQNWTRVSADLLGSVFLYVDYTIPVQEIRRELEKIVKNSDIWDGKTCVLQVTDATEKTMVLRALVSAPDSSSAWNLRCAVREKLIEYIQKNYPNSLPHLRLQKAEESSF